MARRTREEMARLRAKAQPLLGMMTGKAVADAVGVGTQTAFRWRHAAGIAPQPRSSSPILSRPEVERVAADVRRLIAVGGLTDEQIARRLGVPLAAVLRERG